MCWQSIPQIPSPQLEDEHASCGVLRIDPETRFDHRASIFVQLIQDPYKVIREGRPINVDDKGRQLSARRPEGLKYAEVGERTSDGKADDALIRGDWVWKAPKGHGER